MGEAAKIGILGFTGCGKTTLLGALLLALTRGAESSAFAFHGLQGERTYQDLAAYADNLEKGAWPPRTSVDQVAEYTILLRHRTAGSIVSLRLPELPGELLAEVWRTDHIPRALAFLKDYDAYLLLVDASAGDLSRTVASYVHLLQAIKRAKGLGRDERAPQHPLGIVFTKWDSLAPEEREMAPDELAARATPLLMDFAHSNFPNHRAFAVSSVGACDANGRPLLLGGKLKPVRLFEPFEWALTVAGTARSRGDEAPPAVPPGA